MQNQNKLDNMAEKYKEEMMRLYKSNQKTAAVSAPKVVPVVSEDTEKKLPAVDIKANTEERKAAREPSKATEQLMRPPMPDIPKNYGKGAAEVVKTPAQKSKFPSAEEIMQAETAVQTIATITSDPRFEPAGDLPHNQGNYNYDAPEPLEDLEDYIEDIIPDIDYPDNDTDFEDLFDDDDDDDNYNAPDMKGTGYLQVEVTTGNGAVPVPKAAVIVTQELGGQSYLVTMKLTDRSGATDVIPLPAPSASFSESPDPTERPFSEYNVTVYKKGFYTVPEVTVPIFDTVKSIQPVALIPLAENELQGTQRPDGGAMNG
ncbi:MAG: carboxypeptidase regulatory-like domain-containing protein [Oscillospiraceae bacterium]|nr:carboxypeptidase regulatory-like domain-containing protein [Oscillospiraceae bacterium]